MEINEIEKISVESSFFETIIKICSAPSVIFSAFIDFIFSLHSKGQFNNVADVVNQHTSDLNIIKETLGGKNFYLNTPVYVEDLLSTLQKAKDEANGKKRELYAAYLTACCHPENINCSSKTIYLNKLSQLDEVGLLILQYLGNYSIPNRIMTALFVDKGVTINTEDLYNHLYDLESMKVIEKINIKDFLATHKRGGNRMPRNSENRIIYKRTSLGNGLYNFIISGIPNE